MYFNRWEDFYLKIQLLFQEVNFDLRKVNKKQIPLLLNR